MLCSNDGGHETTDQTLINDNKWNALVNLLPKWISAVFKEAGERLNKARTGLFFIINNNSLPAVQNIKDSVVKDSAKT